MSSFRAVVASDSDPGRPSKRPTTRSRASSGSAENGARAPESLGSRSRSESWAFTARRSVPGSRSMSSAARAAVGTASPAGSWTSPGTSPGGTSVAASACRLLARADPSTRAPRRLAASASPGRRIVPRARAEAGSAREAGRYRARAPPEGLAQLATPPEVLDELRPGPPRVRGPFPWPLHVRAWASCAEFEQDLMAGRIEPEVRAVMYDPEGWDKTPLAERQDPVTFIHRFARLARERGSFKIG